MTNTDIVHFDEELVDDPNPQDDEDFTSLASISQGEHIIFELQVNCTDFVSRN